MRSSDFHCKEKNETTGAVHLIQTFLVISPEISRVRSLANHRNLVFHQKSLKFSRFLQKKKFGYFSNRVVSLKR
jgi:hypothetical protein